MTKKQAESFRYWLDAMSRLGIDFETAHKLRRIEMTLHRWAEMECGDSNDYQSWAIARGSKINGEFVYDDQGKPFLEVHSHSESKARYYPTPDRERGALKRLAKIMAQFPDLVAYNQTDPRGCALYILQKSDIKPGEDISAVYSRGICANY